MKYRILVLSCILTGMHMPIAEAFENVEFSGYMTVMATYARAKKANSAENTKYGNSYVNNRLGFDSRGNTIGFQASTEVSDKLNFTLVLQAMGGSDEIDAEWAYASYSATDDLTLHLGRFKGPFFMVSEYSTVGYAYPWVTPPQEVYSINPIESVTGLNLVYQTDVGNWDWLFQVYTGSGKNEATVLPNVWDSNTSMMTNMGISKGGKIDFSINSMIGFNTTLGTQGISFRAGYFSLKTSVDDFGIKDESGSMGGIGLIIDWRNILVYSEYVVRDAQNSTNMRMAFPDQKAGYITFGYRFGDFMPYFTVANMDKGKNDNKYALKQSSFTLGFRYEAGPTAAIKFEATQVKPDGDAGDIGKYGLFDDPVKNNKGHVIAASFDLIF